VSPLPLPPRQFVRHYQLQQTHDDDDYDDDDVSMQQVLLGKLTLTQLVKKFQAIYKLGILTTAPQAKQN
jgi:hypothetical protein